MVSRTRFATLQRARVYSELFPFSSLSNFAYSSLHCAMVSSSVSAPVMVTVGRFANSSICDNRIHHLWRDRSVQRIFFRKLDPQHLHERLILFSICHILHVQ